MARKLTYEQVKEQFSLRGYKLVSTEYVKSNLKLSYICPVHPDKNLSITYSKLKEGVGCPYCSNEKRGKAQRKYTIDQVREMFSERGYTLLENEYISSSTKMSYVCPIHPLEVNEIILDNLRKGHGCKFCARENSANKQKHSFDYVKNEFDKVGYSLLESEYINAKTPMKYRCDKHPDKELYIAFSYLLKGSRCKYCSWESIADSKRLSFDYVQNEFKKKGYVLLETEYVDNLTKMKFQCPFHKDDDTYITYGNLQRGSGCALCAREKNRGENNYFWKGGVTELNNYLRQYLYDWKNKSFEKYDYTCFVTGVKGNYLEVHHTKPFNVIRDEVLNKLNIPLNKYIKDYSQEILKQITKLFLDIHYQNLGVPLSKEIHTLFHEFYGFDENVTFDDLLEFKERYANKEFELVRH